MKTIEKACDVILEMPEFFTESAVKNAQKTQELLAESRACPEFRIRQLNDCMTDLANLWLAAQQSDLATELLSKTYTEIPAHNPIQASRALLKFRPD